MQITVLSENSSRTGLPVEHGLSLHIQTTKEQILFDMGQSDLFAQNADKLGIDIAAVDTAIISHGHYDHGGGLKYFLKKNSLAPIFIHSNAFDPHYSLKEDGLKFIGLDSSMKSEKRIIFTHDYMMMDNQKCLFANVRGKMLTPSGNRLLFGEDKTTNDQFSDEQNLIIQEADKVVLFAGCAHNGIFNILQKAEEVTSRKITHVFGGMHLMKSGLDEKDELHFLDNWANELKKFSGCHFYTMHCTGEKQFSYLKNSLKGQISYLSCGDRVTI